MGRYRQITARPHCRISFCRTILFLSLLIFANSSCNDPILWTLSNEKKIEKGNLDKDSSALAMGDDGKYYFIQLGRVLWYRPIGNRIDWQEIEFPTPVTGVGGRGAGNVLVATEDGLYRLNGITPILEDINIDYAKIMSDGAVVTSSSDPSGWGATMVNGVGGYQGDIVGYNGNGVYVDSVGKNTSLYGNGLNVTGADDGLIITSESVGMDNNWSSSNNEFYSSRYCISGKKIGVPQIKGLVGTNENGYYEAYINEGETLVNLREPINTVNDQDAYLASDLSESLITGFYAGYNGEFFIFTMDKGLWSNDNGEFYWE